MDVASKMAAAVLSDIAEGRGDRPAWVSPSPTEISRRDANAAIGDAFSGEDGAWPDDPLFIAWGEDGIAGAETGHHRIFSGEEKRADMWPLAA